MQRRAVGRLMFYIYVDSNFMHANQSFIKLPCQNHLTLFLYKISLLVKGVRPLPYQTKTRTSSHKG